MVISIIMNNKQPLMTVIKIKNNGIYIYFFVPSFLAGQKLDGKLVVLEEDERQKVVYISSSKSHSVGSLIIVVVLFQ